MGKGIGGIGSEKRVEPNEESDTENWAGEDNASS